MLDILATLLSGRYSHPSTIYIGPQPIIHPRGTEKLTSFGLNVGQCKGLPQKSSSTYGDETTPCENCLRFSGMNFNVARNDHRTKKSGARSINSSGNEIYNAYKLSTRNSGIV